MNTNSQLQTTSKPAKRPTGHSLCLCYQLAVVKNEVDLLPAKKPEAKKKLGFLKAV